MRLFLIFLLLACSLAAPAFAAPAGKVLLVASGHGRDQGKARPGFEYDEFAQAWLVFRSSGFAVEVASPAGGAVEADAYEADKPYNARVLADPAARAALAATRATASVQAGEHDAIYLLGGGGAMFDLAADPALKALLASAWEKGAVIGGVCHGPAVLADVRLAGGRFLVEGRRVTGFTNAEEAAFGERWSKSYGRLLEDGLKGAGARFEQGPVMLPHVVADGRLVTGQNPFSTALAAEAMIRATGREPAPRTPWSDERSLLLVGRMLAGRQAEAEAELAAAPDAHDLMLIGMYGNQLAAQAAGDPAQAEKALAIMQLAAARVWHPRLELAMAEAERSAGRMPQARERLRRLLTRQPDLTPARRLLEAMPE